MNLSKAKTAWSIQTTLDAFTKELQSHKYNGKSAPTLIYVSPVAHENVGDCYPMAWNITEPGNVCRRHEDLAETNKIGFIDLFEPSKKSMGSSGEDHLTINGIHLNDKGYRLATNWMGEQLGLSEIKDSTGYTVLNNLVKSRTGIFLPLARG